MRNNIIFQINNRGLIYTLIISYDQHEDFIVIQHRPLVDVSSTPEGPKLRGMILDK